MTTWNSQALMAVDPIRHAAKWRLLAGLVKDSSMIGIQETRADESELLDAAATFAPAHKCYAGRGDHSQAGGVAVLLRHDVGDLANSIQVDIIPGRALAVEVPATDAQDPIVFMTVHNFDFDAERRRLLVQYVRATLCRTPNPVIFAVGDSNLPELDSDTLTTTESGETHRSTSTRARRERTPFLTMLSRTSNRRELPRR